MNLTVSMTALFVWSLALSARAEVRVFVQNTNGVALINYECLSGEVVRAFALDVSVNVGQIIGISNFFRGPSTAVGQGYGIFPASLRDHVTLNSATNVDWDVKDYTPLAVMADAPADTMPGLNSSGVTLEFGGLWDPAIPAAVPGATGCLCALILSKPAYVSVAANQSRGGVVSAFTTIPPQVVFNGATITPSIISASLHNGILNILFSGGELQTATSANGPWTSTGDQSGNHDEIVGTNQTEFFRVHNP